MYYYWERNKPLKHNSIWVLKSFKFELSIHIYIFSKLKNWYHNSKLWFESKLECMMSLVCSSDDRSAKNFQNFTKINFMKFSWNSEQLPVLILPFGRSEKSKKKFIYSLLDWRLITWWIWHDQSIFEHDRLRFFGCMIFGHVQSHWLNYWKSEQA